MPLVECVPNFSEGRRPEVVEAIVAAISSVGGIALLDREMDADHNRSVVTFAGEPEAVLEAAFQGAREAARRIDLNHHKGEHPRMGATDVVPFVPLAGSTLADCVNLAERFAQRLARELSIPTYLYGEAARRPERKDLPNVRKGEFEGLRALIETDPARAPDFGPKKVHPTAGATAVGARDFLIAFNVNLATDNLEIAKKIASEIREANGGLPGVRAKGFLVDGGKTAQVSMNLVDYRKTAPGRATREVAQRAQKLGHVVQDTEVVGLVPREALVLSALDLIRPRGFAPGQILENRLEEAGLGSVGARHAVLLQGFLEALASPDPAPGGGSVAALGGALGAALAAMVLSLTAQKAQPDPAARMRVAADEARRRMGVLYALIEKDSKAYEAVVKALALPKTTPLEKEARSARLREAMKLAIEVPLETMSEGIEAFKCLRSAAQLGSVHALSDVGVGVLSARMCVKGAAHNVETNLKSVKDASHAADYRSRMDAFLVQALGLEGEIEKTVASREA